MPTSRHTRYAVGGVATSSTGIIFVAVANHDWNTALGAAGTVAPALLVYVIANGGIKGVARRIWSGLPFTATTSSKTAEPQEPRSRRPRRRRAQADAAQAA